MTESIANALRTAERIHDWETHDNPLSDQEYVFAHSVRESLNLPTSEVGDLLAFLSRNETNEVSRDPESLPMAAGLLLAPHLLNRPQEAIPIIEGNLESRVHRVAFYHAVNALFCEDVLHRDQLSHIVSTILTSHKDVDQEEATLLAWCVAEMFDGAERSRMQSELRKEFTARGIRVDGQLGEALLYKGE